MSYDEPNYPPEFLNFKPEIDVVEGEKNVAKVEAVDKNRRQKISFALAGEDAQLFEIDSAGGEISFLNPPSFSEPRDNNEDNIYEIKVIATDSGYPEESVIENLSVKVLDQKLKLLSFGGKSDVEFATSEGKKEVLMVEAAKVLEDSGEIVYSLLPGGDSEAFMVDPAGGALSFEVESDYENPKDRNRDNVYEVSVRATDSLSDDFVVQNFEITVLDVEENEAPVILTGDRDEEVSADEFKKRVTAIKTEDPNGDGVSLALGTYGDSDLFEINSESTDLSFRQAPDYENPKDRNRDNIYEVEIIATDDGNPPLSSSKIIKVYVNNLGRPQILFYRGGSNEEVCKDSRASNFSPNGIHNQKLCVYEKDDYNYGQRKVVYTCPTDKLLTQNMIIGDRDGKYSG